MSCLRGIPIEEVKNLNEVYYVQCFHDIIHKNEFVIIKLNNKQINNEINKYCLDYDSKSMFTTYEEAEEYKNFISKKKI